MRRFLFLFLSVTVVWQGQSQQDTIHRADRINSRIQNEKTAAHINIRGTRLYLVPPSGFRTPDNFTGLVKNDQAIMNVYDLAGGDFYTSAATFNRTGFQQQGLRVLDYREIKVNGFPGRFASLQGDSATKIYGLLFGDASFSTMIMASYPANDDPTRQAIIRSLNSIFYDKTQKIDPLAVTWFTLDDRVSRFKFLLGAGGVYIYTVGGTDDRDRPGAPGLIVTPFEADTSLTMQALTSQVLAKYTGKGFNDVRITNFSDSTVNGYEAVEMLASGKLQDVENRLYFLVVRSGDRAVSIVGIARDDPENNLAEFRKLAHTIRFK